MAPPTSILSAAESSYILDSLLLTEPVRTDGRPLAAFRAFSLATAVAPQANGSARVLLGGGASGAGGTEVVTAIRLEVGAPAPGINEGASSVGARPDVICSIECAPSAFPHLDYKAIEAQSQYLTTLVQHTLPSLLPLQPITPLLAFSYTIDVLIQSSAGNLVDALFLSIRAALHDLRIPRTRNVAFEASLLGEEGESDMAGIKQAAMGKKKQMDKTRKDYAAGAEFELEDSNDEGDRLPLAVREALPVCITLHILPNGTHLLDPTAAEAFACPAHLLVFIAGPQGTLAGLRLVGSAELGLADMRRLTEAGKTVGLNLMAATNAQLKQAGSAAAEASAFNGGLGFFGS